MSLYKIQGKAERLQGIYYEFDTESEPLGEGGMGKVYRGRCVDQKTGHSRDVAVKFMYSDLPPYAIEKARREAGIYFKHTNLIEMLGFIETEDTNMLGEKQHHYHVVSELLEGVSLDALFSGKLTDQEGHYVPFAEKYYKDFTQDHNHFAVDIIKNILSGLITMHDAGYIHRDIDPTNIMLTKEGNIKLIDFGIAKKMHTLTTHDKHLTQAGQFIGKPEYAAPELVLGAIDEQNQTTDIYAVGILLFQCIVGHLPFEGDRSDVLQKQLHSALPLKLIKHKGLRKIVETATQKSRAKRFQSAAEFRVALEKIDLSANTSSFAWKPLYTYIAVGVAACTLLGIVVNKLIDLPAPTEDAPVVDVEDSTEEAPDLLANLQKLSGQGNSDATYLLSRLYFKSLKPGDYCPDSIVEMRQNLNVESDHQKAHQLLELAVEQNPNNYQALYELACDFWGGNQRTTAVEREPKKAKELYLRASKAASDANDKKYVEMSEDYIKAINVFLENSKKYNLGQKVH